MDEHPDIHQARQAKAVMDAERALVEAALAFQEAEDASILHKTSGIRRPRYIELLKAARAVRQAREQQEGER